MTAMLGNVTTTGNVSGAYIKGNGSQLTGLVSTIVAGPGISISGPTDAVTITNNNPNAYTNSNVTSLLASFGSNTVSTTGSITGGNILGNGSGLTGLVTSIIAGSGISVNAATGAVTVTATGGGGNSSVISSGNAFANTAHTSNSILIYNGNVSYAASGLTLANNSIALQSNFNGSSNLSAMVIASDGNINFTTKSNSNYYNFGSGIVRVSVGGPSVEITPTGITASTINAGTIGNAGAAFTGGNLTISGSASLAGNIFTTPVTKTGTSVGTPGQFAVDGNYIYICTSTNVWKRAVLSSF
jgi:hypothetical protein